jgi:hypothetical protein
MGPLLFWDSSLWSAGKASTNLQSGSHVVAQRAGSLAQTGFGRMTAITSSLSHMQSKAASLSLFPHPSALPARSLQPGCTNKQSRLDGGAGSSLPAFTAVTAIAA